MKNDIHPNYRKVVFHDTSADSYFLIGSTLETDRTVEYEGQEYPYFTVDVSSKSHPFYTGEQRVAQSDGRVAKFNKRFGKRTPKWK